MPHNFCRNASIGAIVALLCVGVASPALASSGGGLPWEGPRRLMYVVLVAGILLGATQIVGLFGASGASIGLPDQAAPGGRGEGTDG